MSVQDEFFEQLRQAKWVRDPEASCELYDPSPPEFPAMPTMGDCEGDGHWLCKRCRRYISEEV